MTKTTKEEMYKIATQILESKGHKLLEPSIPHYRAKLNIVDDKGRPYQQTWESIKQGYGSTLHKSDLQSSRNRKYSIEDLHKYAESKGGKCLSQVYIKDSYKYLWEDASGFQWKACWKTIKNGAWSPNEKRISLSQSKTKYTIEFCRNLAKKYQGECLSDEYNPKDGIVTWKDRQGNVFSRAVTRVVQAGDLLFYEKSHQEAAIFDYISQLGLVAERNNRSILQGNREIDVYIPEKKVGIEYHGLKWHTEKRETTTTKQKYTLAQKAGIKLFQVFEHEWKDRQEQVKGFIRSKVDSNTHKIGARQCELRPVEKEQARDFLNKYHIKGGKCEIKHAYGLFYKEELLMLVTFAPHHRTRSEMVLNRCVTRFDWTVAGGLSKLCKHAKAELGSFVTWIDKCWSNGDSWVKSGWEIVKDSTPDYFYYNPTTKKVMSKHSAKGRDGVTEKEKAQGFEKVWDAGKIKLRF